MSRGVDTRVLVVVHHVGLRDQLVAALQSRGMPATSAQTGREALDALDGDLVGALIIDSELPLIGGFELAKAVRRHPRGAHLPLVVVTDARWSPSQKAAALQQMGLLDLLSKPVDPMQVAELLVAELASASVEAPEPLADQASRDEKHHVEKAVRAVRTEPVLLRGNLQTTPFPELLHQLYAKRAVGALFLLRDNVKKIVYFKEGHPSYVKSNVLAECLGKVLVREKMISEGDCAESLRRMKETRRQQGTVLIEMGVISPQNLVVGLELQLQAKLLDIFSWTRGEYLFKRDVKLPSEVIALEWNNATLIAEGVRRRWDPPRLKQALEPLLDRYLAPARDPKLRFQEFPLDEVDQVFAAEMDGRRTLRELLAATPLTEARALCAAYVLITTGVVAALGAPQADEEEAAEAAVPPEQALRGQLAAELISFRRRDPFGVLGVAVGSSDEDVEEAYSRLARKYHPDRFRNVSAETRELALEIFRLAHQAYQTVATHGQRQEYKARLRTGEVSVLSEAGGRSLHAERLASQARGAIEGQRYGEARQALAGAVQLCPDAGDLRALLGWAIFHEAPDDPENARDAVQQLRRAVELAPRDEQGYLLLGRVYARMGKMILAQRQFERAVQCNPASSEALAELERYRDQLPQRRFPR
ncbi:MAG: response regulator [Deltaproteobacteria bacterium]|nr:response regulator [Deltaproteobacteria bacterium]